MSTTLRYCAVFIVVGSLACSTGNAALTPVQNGTYASISDGTFTDFSPGFSSSLGFDTPITGFKKFDSSLGTLTGVILTLDSAISGQAYLEYSFESSETIPENDPNFGDDFSMSFDSFVQTDIIYNSISVVNDLFDAAVYEESTVTSSGYSTPDSTLIYYYSGSPQPIGGGPNTSNGSLSAFTLGDFAGSPTDDLIALSVGFFIEIDESSLSTSSNLFGSLDPSNVFIDISVTLEAGTATLQYEYTPVPEPAATVVLFGLLAVGSIALSRRHWQ